MKEGSKEGGERGSCGGETMENMKWKRDRK
jgi:hypothetical protein